jgi:hypothetical protein
MPVQTTPHTQTQQDAVPSQADLDTNQQPGDSGQEEDASLYENMDGAQAGGTRAFNANAMGGHHLNVEPFTAAVDGGTSTRTPESEQQGITNHPASEENVSQRKVVSERPDAQAGVDQSGHRAS